MGNTNWDAGAYSNYSRSVASSTQQQIFTNTSGCHADLDPSKFIARESCDSPANPLSTPIIIGVDETGSMGHLATEIIKQGLGVVMQGIYDRKPVPDPHILLAAVGDSNCDSSPLQTTQFETDMKLVEQIEKFYIEGGGGGNGGESYPLVWWFALNKTKCDAISKRGRRGYLFTIGDEAPHKTLSRDQIKRFLGANAEQDVSVSDLLRDVQSRWNVFHLITPTDTTTLQGAEQQWKALLNERAVVVSDHKKLGEVIVSIMQVNEGQEAEDVAKSWGGDAALVVRSAVSGLAKRSKGGLQVEVLS